MNINAPDKLIAELPPVEHHRKLNKEITKRRIIVAGGRARFEEARRSGQAPEGESLRAYLGEERGVFEKIRRDLLGIEAADIEAETLEAFEEEISGVLGQSAKAVVSATFEGAEVITSGMLSAFEVGSSRRPEINMGPSMEDLTRKIGVIISETKGHLSRIFLARNAQGQARILAETLREENVEALGALIREIQEFESLISPAPNGSSTQTASEEPVKPLMPLIAPVQLSRGESTPVAFRDQNGGLVEFPFQVYVEEESGAVVLRNPQTNERKPVVSSSGQEVTVETNSPPSYLKVGDLEGTSNPKLFMRIGVSNGVLLLDQGGKVRVPKES